MSPFLLGDSGKSSIARHDNQVMNERSTPSITEFMPDSIKLIL